MPDTYSRIDRDSKHAFRFEDLAQNKSRSKSDTGKAGRVGRVGRKIREGDRGNWIFCFLKSRAKAMVFGATLLTLLSEAQVFPRCQSWYDHADEGAVSRWLTCGN